MNPVGDYEPATADKRTTLARKGERELVLRRTFDAPVRVVYEAWTKPELLRRWWVPKSAGLTLLSCEADVRTGGRYRFEVGQEGARSMVFLGRYTDVLPRARLVWTNEESAEGAVTTVTFEERDGQTLLAMHEIYPSKEALESSLAGMENALRETFGQLNELLITLRAGEERP